MTPEGPRVVALGGGHGLAATLGALRRVTDDVTAIVTVADDGGSSGRLRRELGVLPPGDLRMALAALCGDDEWGQTWSKVVQHRFAGGGELHGHAVGNLLIVALWELLGDTVDGLDWVGRLLGVQGRVLPMCSVPLEMVALVGGIGPDGELLDDSLAAGSASGSGRRASVDAEPVEVRGQVAVAMTRGRVLGVRVEPPNPPGCAEALAAVQAADWVLLGPGSWFTSVLPHVLVPDLARALVESPARRIVNLNLVTQPGETEGYSPASHLEVLASHAPDLRIDVVVADSSVENEPDVLAELEVAAASLGAKVVCADVAAPGGIGSTPRHDPARLAAVYRDLFRRGRIN